MTKNEKCCAMLSAAMQLEAEYRDAGRDLFADKMAVFVRELGALPSASVERLYDLLKQ